MKVGGDTFLQLLQNQLKTASTRALFNQVSTTYDATVIFLDLASEMLAGATMEDISDGSLRQGFAMGRVLGRS